MMSSSRGTRHAWTLKNEGGYTDQVWCPPFQYIRTTLCCGCLCVNTDVLNGMVPNCLPVTVRALSSMSPRHSGQYYLPPPLPSFFTQTVLRSAPVVAVYPSNSATNCQPRPCGTRFEAPRGDMNTTPTMEMHLFITYVHFE